MIGHQHTLIHDHLVEKNKKEKKKQIKKKKQHITLLLHKDRKIKVDQFSTFIFSPFWRDKFLVGSGRKCMDPTKNCPSFLSLPNNIKFYFLSFLFYCPYFTSNQTHPQTYLQSPCLSPRHSTLYCCQHINLDPY